MRSSATFSQGAALDPSNGRGLAAYAEFLYWILERPEEGRSVLKRALWVDPLSASARLKDAVFTLAESGIKASEQKNLQVLELDPNFVPALQRYGVFRWRFDGKLVEAIQFIEHAIALDPNNSRLRQNAEAMYLDLGDVTAARDVAAGTLPNVRTAGLLSMYEGDWRRAGLAAYDEAGWTKRRRLLPKLAGKRSNSRLCNEDWRFEPGDRVHQTEVLLGRRSSGTPGPM